MAYKEKKCEYILCDIVFTPTKHNQAYCRTEHGVLENNRKAMEKYHERKSATSKKRVCECGTILSRYNPESKCAACLDKDKQIQRDRLLEALSGNIKD